jgi:hypothetical protein
MIDEAREKALAEIVDRADQGAANVVPIMRQIQCGGATSLQQIAEAVSARGINAPRGGQWGPRRSDPAIDAAARLDRFRLSRGMSLSDPASLRAHALRYRELKGREITWALPS